jgi:predicted nucleic acid-binding protein
VKLYLDSSAIVKLVQTEPETAALGQFLVEHRDDEQITSALARVEVVRAVWPGGADAVANARRTLQRRHQLALNTDILDRAAGLAPDSSLRSLDAIHLASAQLLGAELRAVVTYDQRMAESAALLRLPVAAPA